MPDETLGERISPSAEPSISNGTIPSVQAHAPTVRRFPNYDDEDYRQIEAHRAYLSRRKWITIGVLTFLIGSAITLFQIMGRGTLVSRVTKADLKEVQRLASEHPEDREVQIAAGKREIDEGLVSEAHARMKRLAGRYPDDFDVAAGLARTAAMSGNAHEAVEAYQKVLTLNPRANTSRVLLAQIFKEAGLYTDALAEYEKALAVDPKILDWNPLYGECLVEAGRYEEALKHLSKVVNQMRMADDGFPPLTVAAIKLGRQAEAEKLIAQRLRSNPLYFFGEVRQSFVELVLSQPLTPARLKSAEDQARASLGDDRAQYYWGLSRVLQLEGKYREAFNIAGQGLARDKNHRGCLRVLAETAGRIGDNATAASARARLEVIERPEREIDRLRSRVDAAPDDRETYLALATAYERMGRYARAAETIQKLLKRKGDDSQAAALLQDYRKRAIDNLMLTTKTPILRPHYVPEE